jgi:hypothetical protein
VLIIATGGGAPIVGLALPKFGFCRQMLAIISGPVGDAETQAKYRLKERAKRQIKQEEGCASGAALEF